MARTNLVLLHGWGASPQKLKPLARKLDELGWKTFLPPIPGFGAPAPKSIWGVTQYSNYIYELAKKEFGNDKFFVFGHSFGGRLALKMAGRKEKKIAGIILCGASGLSRGSTVKRVVFFILAKLGKILLLTPISSIWRNILYKLAGEHDYEKSNGIMRHIFKRVVSEDLKPLIGRIKVPTLILWGKQDKMTPIADALFIKKSVPSSKLVLFEAGHRLPYEKVDKVASEINKWAN